MTKRHSQNFAFAFAAVLAFQFSGMTLAQSASQTLPWPDNIIITKRLISSSQAHEDKTARVEAAIASICAQLGRSYEPSTVKKVFGENDIVTEKIIYLSGRKKLVITESLMWFEQTSETCLAAVRLGTTYDYTAPGESWTLVRSPRGIYSPERHASTDVRDLKLHESLFRNREKNFHTKWRNKKYSVVETYFGHQCGYPISPADLPRPKGMGEYSALYDKAVAAAQSFHQDGPKLCSLVASPVHVGTGEKLVLHEKNIFPNYDEKTGCVGVNESAGLQKRKCFPVVVDFKINAAMPVGIFEKPDWARGAGSKPNGQ